MAVHDAIRRALQRGLSIRGEASSLNGTPCGNVHVARNTAVFAGVLDQANDNHVVRADVATIEVQYTPKVNQTLVHPTDGTLRLTRLLDDNGFSRRFIVVQTAP